MPKIVNNIHPFWGGPFSQWYSCEFRVECCLYNSAEQYMMAKKAELFGDLEVLLKIMTTDDPRKQKALGKLVAGFDKAQWETVARDVVFRANMAKFTQNRDLYDYLMSTGNQLIVEASPYDAIWGVKLGEEDPRIYNQAQWQGTNWLGNVLMDVRSALIPLSTAAE